MTRSTAPAVGTIAALKPDDLIELMVPGNPARHTRVSIRFIERYSDVTRITMKDDDGVKHVRAAQEHDSVAILGKLVTP